MEVCALGYPGCLHWLAKSAAEFYPDAHQQRCVMHFYANARRETHSTLSVSSTAPSTSGDSGTGQSRGNTRRVKSPLRRKFRIRHDISPLFLVSAS
jgi:hypothetical protein